MKREKLGKRLKRVRMAKDLSLRETAKDDDTLALGAGAALFADGTVVATATGARRGEGSPGPGNLWAEWDRTDGMDRMTNNWGVR